eukprot:364868-Chlamydomonas_euryale.AAC.6
MTAVSLSTRSYAVRAGDVVLVHAAGGGTGQLLTQLCRHLGATVIGTASSERKASVASAAGARHVLRYTQQVGGRKQVACSTYTVWGVGTGPMQHLPRSVSRCT